MLIYNAGAFKMKTIADTSAQEFEDSWKVIFVDIQCDVDVIQVQLLWCIPFSERSPSKHVEREEGYYSFHWCYCCFEVSLNDCYMVLNSTSEVELNSHVYLLVNLDWDLYHKYSFISSLKCVWIHYRNWNFLYLNLNTNDFMLTPLKSLAKEVGPQGIHVAHIIIDGQIDTPTVRSYFRKLLNDFRNSNHAEKFLLW